MPWSSGCTHPGSCACVCRGGAAEYKYKRVDNTYLGPEKVIAKDVMSCGSDSILLNGACELCEV